LVDEEEIIMTSISLQSTVSVVKDQISCDLAGEAVILSLKNGMYYSLNPIGVRIWNLIRKPTPVYEIRDSIMNDFEVDSNRCEKELFDILKDMANEGLVQVEP
jgi:hypothetical protein